MRKCLWNCNRAISSERATSKHHGSLLSIRRDSVIEVHNRKAKWAFAGLIAAFSLVVLYDLMTEPENSSGHVGEVSGSSLAAVPPAPPVGEYALVGVEREAAVTVAGSLPCEACLDERGALEVAEVFLFYVLPSHLGVRAMLYSDIPGDPHEQYLPKLPNGLLDAPPDFDLGQAILLPEEADRETTWVVWVHTGWLSKVQLDEYIRAGELPHTAWSWPPVKVERYLLVDARTGKVWPTGITSGTLAEPWPSRHVVVPIPVQAWQGARAAAKQLLGESLAPWTD